MQILWWGLTVIFCISALVGLIRLVNHQLYKKSSSIIILVISLIGSYGFYSLAHQGLSKADQQKTMESFVNQIYKDEQPVFDAETNLQNAFAQFNGSDTSALKEAATKLEDAGAFAEDKNPSVPSGFPGDVDTLLSEANGDFTLAFHDDYNAGASLSKYIDSQNPNDLQNYKDKTAEAKNYMGQANSYLEQAKEKVGIK